MNNVHEVNVNNEGPVAEASRSRSRRSRRKLKAERVQLAAGGRGRQGLKAERVQLAARSGPQKLKAERVQEMLKDLGRGWELTATGGAIGKEWRFAQPRVAAAYAAHLASFAAAEGQAVHLVLSGTFVSLTLTTRLPGGIREVLTENDFRFAARLG